MSNVRPVDVVVVGAINVDLVIRSDSLPAAGETVVGHRFDQFGGGKGANAAVAAARQGAGVRLIGAVGDDDFGSWSLQQLAHDDVTVDGVGEAAVHTGVALIVVDRYGENQIAVGPGANLAVDARLVVGPEYLAAECVLVSTEINPDAVTAAVRAALERGQRCILNPAPVIDAAVDLVGAGAILTPNETELGQLAAALGIAAGDVAEQAVQLARRNRAAVVVTLGSRGVGIAEPGTDRLVTIPARPVEVVDTTGAGDTFNGVLAARLAAGDSLERAVRWSAVAASLSVTVAGARPGMPNAAAVAAAFNAM